MTTPQSFVQAALAAEREQWTGVDKLADAIDRDSYELAVESPRASTLPAPGLDDDEDDPWLCGDDLMGSSG